MTTQMKRSFLALLGAKGRLAAACVAASVVFGPLAAAPKDVALVVVNADYRDLADFDASRRGELVRDALAAAGFEVTLINNATSGALLSALRRMSLSPDPNAAAVFYFSGYARQMRGRNLMLAKNARPRQSFDFVTQGIDLAAVQRALENAGGRMQLLVLDGAYPEPTLDGLEGVEPGLAPPSPGSRSTIVLSAPPGTMLAGPQGGAELAEAFVTALARPEEPMAVLSARFLAEADRRAGRKLVVSLGAEANLPLLAPAEPVPEPEPEPEPQAALPEPQPEPQPTPVPEPEAAPEPVVRRPEPEPVPEPEAEAPQTVTTGAGAGSEQSTGFVAAPRTEPVPEPETPPVTAALSPEEFEATLSFDDRRQIQLALRALGLYQFGIDGLFGPGTRRAIKTFQRLRGFEDTGLINAAQREVLFEIAGL